MAFGKLQELVQVEAEGKGITSPGAQSFRTTVRGGDKDASPPRGSRGRPVAKVTKADWCSAENEASTE
eukprot:CAMPEP_0118997818 /NCGR_PEP_ID=MMETSP1173-20130426/62450_1 /TAXON_ID=1034831 /ORGANISM="Rhizochromulina marina cf, Strain CCMP1243" /LENGTH=67 /DNA_ID=CAMNT_0006949283 /DNA_START=73 /DNA_END=274 /DNA_ORIENTATION=-